MNDVFTKMARGAAWMIAARVSIRLIGLFSTVILARILIPADFGLVIMATAIIAALQLLGAFSFDLALIQNPNAERRHYDTVWTIGLLVSAALALSLILLANPAASFYNEPRLAAVMYALSVGMFLEGFINVGVVAFRKEMQFDKEFAFLFATKLAAVIVTVTLAVTWRDYWALVVGSLTGTIVALVLSYLLQPYRPRFSLDARGELFRFSRWLFLNNTLGFLYHRAADFILAKAAGPAGLGFYSVAYEISTLPSSELVAPIHRAIFPGYARLSNDIVGMRHGFIKVIAMIALLITPAAVGLACIADPLVKVVLGPKWAPAIPVIQVLAINGVLTVLWTCSGYVFLAMGKPRTVTLMLATHLLLALPLMTVAAFNWGLVAVAWMLLCASLMVLPLTYFLLSAALELGAMDLLRVFWRPIVGATVMAASLIAAQGLLVPNGDTGKSIIDLSIYVILGALIYCIVVVVLWLFSSRPSGAERFVFQRLKEAISITGRAAP
jgi:lipopolysaccharide exporter